MARTQKGTRARGLPPKLLLSRKQETTGSFPTVWRTSSDNRTGRYGRFFDDAKTMPFDQQVTYDTNLFAAYEEKEVTVTYPSSTASVGFDYSFGGNPIVVITELSASDGSTVNSFISSLSGSSFTASFSAPFAGSFVYRALYDSPVGEVRTVVRSPRFPSSYSKVVATFAAMGGVNTAEGTFSDFGSTPSSSFVTFYDQLQTGLANVSASVTYLSNTSFALTSSANTDAEAYFLGSSNATTIPTPQGIVYPLVMTPEAISKGLSGEDQAELYKQAYLISGSLVNQPIVTSGKMVRNVSDAFVTFTPGQYLEPWEVREGRFPSSSFYLTGSAVSVAGTGFQQPLWSKNMIEMDLTPSTGQTFSALKGPGNGSYPMAYWNPTSKLYEGIGSGKGIDSYSSGLTGLRDALAEQVFGFAPSVDDGAALKAFPQGAYNIIGRPISNYGFPYHSKFQPTSSQLIPASNIISEPFLLEKVVLEISGTLTVPAVSSTAVMTFFLLNRRAATPNQIIGQQTIGYVASSSANVLTTTTSSVSSTTFLDLVDHMQFSLSASADTSAFLPRREALLIKTTPWAGIISQQVRMESVVKNPVGYEESFLMPFNGALTAYNAVKCQLKSSGRNQYTETNGRDWTNSFVKPIVIGTAAENLGVTDDRFPISSTYTKPNPYILLPGDQLVFGFQLPVSRVNNETTHSSFQFATTGVNRITLYGSTLRFNEETGQLEEYHEDTLNQLLCSDIIHETVIGTEG
jgi:hypothetical protein